MISLCHVAASFYHTIHYSAKNSPTTACCLSARLSVCNVGWSGSHRLEILETNCTDN